MKLTNRGTKAKAYTFKDPIKMAMPITNRYRFDYMRARTRSEDIIFKNNFADLNQIVSECAQLVSILPEVMTIDKHTNTFEECEQFLDEVTDHKNFIESDEVKNGYTNRYDLRQVGHYLYKNPETHADVYHEGLLDKFHKWVSILYYQAQQLAEDFIENENVVVPVSACETPWILDER